MAKKKKPTPAPIVPEAPPTPVIRHKSPWGYVVLVCGSLNPKKPDRMVTDEDNIIRSPWLLEQSGHVPLYSIRGKDWSDCMKTFNEIQGFGPYQPME